MGCYGERPSKPSNHHSLVASHGSQCRRRRRCDIVYMDIEEGINHDDCRFQGVATNIWLITSSHHRELTIPRRPSTVIRYAAAGHTVPSSLPAAQWYPQPFSGWHLTVSHFCSVRFVLGRGHVHLLRLRFVLCRVDCPVLDLCLSDGHVLCLCDAAKN